MTPDDKKAWLRENGTFSHHVSMNGDVKATWVCKHLWLIKTAPTLNEAAGLLYDKVREELYDECIQ